MGTAISELPLAIFTTLAPIGAGAFIVLAVLFLTTNLSKEQAHKIDLLSLIPFIVLVIGFLASIFHLANPGHMMHLFSGFGTSPLSNEVVVGIIFVVVTAIYGICALAGVLKTGVARKVFIVIVALLALVFDVFIGMAYMMDTIAGWYTVLIPIQILGYSLLGGVILGILMLSLAGLFKDVCKGGLFATLIVLLICGIVCALVGLCGQAIMVSGISNPMESGADLVAAVAPELVIAIVCLVLAAIAGFVLLGIRRSAALVTIATVLMVAGVFLGRLVFYALELSVGL
ncbi:MAG: dimethyl sulfoxide reductase anchor subunit [Coriobacteriaceae bacterium]|nr:dimethyl sulfoxide reductase anchor subunit [Coriobacteriaceae bacterium]